MSEEKLKIKAVWEVDPSKKYIIQLTGHITEEGYRFAKANIERWLADKNAPFALFEDDVLFECIGDREDGEPNIEVKRP
jgi:hypothetical protein